MNVIEYKSLGFPICFCFVDNTHRYTSAWTRELIKNQSDFSLSNIHSKGYDIYQGQDEDTVLTYVSNLEYTHAVVFSTGTEFINGRQFFDEVERLVTENFFIAGHILDRKEAYYELHSQCYIVNLEYYKKLDCPLIGQQALGEVHTQIAPYRSLANYHDDYTPVAVSSGSAELNYSHKCHGWNILSKAFINNYPVIVFSQEIRNSKKHYYPENQSEFLNHVQWAYQRFNYCSREFVHTSNTEEIKLNIEEYEQLITPASGDWFLNCIGKGPLHVIIYDYNQKSLDYWKNKLPVLNNVSYEFINIDLLTDKFETLIKNENLKTLVNITNIFCYEGTAMFYSLEYRLKKELEFKNALPKSWTLLASDRSWSGFAVDPLSIKDLKKPTWHIKDWNE